LYSLPYQPAYRQAGFINPINPLPSTENSQINIYT
jgi:hypothetical protein